MKKQPQAKEPNSRSLNQMLGAYKGIEEAVKEELRDLEFFKQVLRSIREDVPSPSEIVVSEKSWIADKMKKTGTTLILTAPVPVVSDVVGASLFVTGVLAEYRKRKKVQETLSSYIEFITESPL